MAIKLNFHRSRVFAAFLYALPILFFFISYFLLTTSGEDIFQGANHLRTGTPLDPIGDAINAFNFNSRITDMYAWSVIDFFDYQFCFGPDLIFRLLDVILATSVLYLSTSIILGRRPEFRVKDALAFCAVFIAIIITPFGRPFYIEFSMIHNYVPLALILLLFSLPYLSLLKNPATKPRHPLLSALGMVILGLIFGMSTTVTPLAFLATVIIYVIIRRKSLSRPPLWFFAGLAGTIIGFAICWFAGSGVSHYTNSTTAATFDYLALSDIFQAPLTTVPRLLWHEIYNFGITIIPLLIISITCIIFSKNRQLLHFKSFPNSTQNLILIIAIFTVVHLLGVSQIQAPPRLLMPAYLASVILLLKLFLPRISSPAFTATATLVTIIIVLLHIAFLTIYHARAAAILSEIKNSPSSTLCFDLSTTAPPYLPIVNLSQANIFVDWGVPQSVYGKDITFCK